MKIVAFGHRRRVGKDTCAKFLMQVVKTHFPNTSAICMGFADAVKDTAYKLFRWTGLQPGAYYENPNRGDLKDKPLPNHPTLTPRDIWIHVGESLREICPELWVKSLELWVPPKTDLLIIYDLRKIPEANYIVENGGFCYRVLRDVPKFPDPVDSELEHWTGWTGDIVNDSDLSTLFGKMFNLAKEILNEQ